MILHPVGNDSAALPNHPQLIPDKVANSALQATETAKID